MKHFVLVVTICLAVAVTARPRIFSKQRQKNSNAIDWDSVEVVVQEYRQHMLDALTEIINISIADNEIVGQIISDKVNNLITQLLAVLAELDREVCNKTLTIDSARPYLSRCESILFEAQLVIKEDVMELSLAAAEAIKEAFIQAYLATKTLDEELFRLLIEFMTSS